MIYMGVDVHKSYLEIAEIDQEGTLLQRSRVPNNPQGLDQLAVSLKPGTKVAMESCSYFYPLYNRLEDAGVEVKVAHPLKVKLIAESSIKTDKVDALILAQLLRLDYLPTSYIPPRETRQIRDLLRHRIALVRQRTQVKNRIHHLLEKNGVKTKDLGHSDLYGKRGMVHLRMLELQPAERSILDLDLDLIESINRLLDRSESILAREALDNPEVRLLMTIPGVGYFTALLLLMEIGDISRFSSPKKLCSYVGLVPRLYQSGEKRVSGRITKQGNKWIRYVIVEAVGHAVRCGDSELACMYRRIKARRGGSVAKVACSRKLLRIIWFMLVRGEPYRYAKPGLFEKKIRSMERMAGKNK